MLLYVPVATHGYSPSRIYKKPYLLSSWLYTFYLNNFIPLVLLDSFTINLSIVDLNHLFFFFLRFCNENHIF
jgi:hypothetical protein